MGYYPKFPLAIPHLEARRNALLARPPLSPPKWFSCDLHALTMPPAFILSQDQTLQLNIVAIRSEDRRHCDMKVCPAPTTEVAGRSPQVSNNLRVSKSINLKGAHLSMSLKACTRLTDGRRGCETTSTSRICTRRMPSQGPIVRSFRRATFSRPSQLLTCQRTARFQRLAGLSG